MKRRDNSIPRGSADFGARAECAARTLEELAKAVNAEILFITCVADLYISTSGPVSEETHGTVPVLTELLAFHLSPWFGISPDITPRPDEVERALKSLHDLFNAKALMEIAEPETPDAPARVVQRVQRRWKIVRGESYPQQTAERILMVQDQFNDWLTARLGVGPKRALDILWAIYRERAVKAHRFMPDVLAYSEATLATWHTARKKRLNELSTEEQLLVRLKSKKVRRHGYLERLTQVAIDHLPVANSDLTLELSVSAEEWESVIRLIGLTSDDRAQMASSIEIRSRALIALSDKRLFLTDLTHAFDLLWERLELEIQTDSTVYQAYQKARSTWLEDKAYGILCRIFPKGCVYRNLSYPDPRRPRATAELDLAVRYGPFLLLVEAKAAQFRFESQLGDVGRLRTDLRKNIEHAFEQARRAAYYIKNSSSPEFTEITTGNKMILNKDGIERIYLLTISLRHLGGIANQLASTQALGLFKDGELPFSLSIADLEMIIDFSEGPEIFLHYIDRFLEIQSNFPTIMADELDYFGAYLQTRLLPNTRLLQTGKSAGMVWVGGWASVFDDHMSYQRGERTAPPEPLELQIPAEIREVLAELRRIGEPQALWTAFALLDTSDEALSKIAHAFQEIRRARLVPNQIRYLVHQDRNTAISVLGAIAPPSDFFTAKVRERVALEKYRRKTSRSIGFGVAIDQPERLFECYAFQEGTWERDEALEEESRLSSLFRVGAGGKLPSRNDPCVCGSDKKFKKCCLPKMER